MAKIDDVAQPPSRQHAASRLRTLLAHLDARLRREPRKMRCAVQVWHIGRAEGSAGGAATKVGLHVVDVESRGCEVAGTQCIHQRLLIHFAMTE